MYLISKLLLEVLATGLAIPAIDDTVTGMQFGRYKNVKKRSINQVMGY